SAARRGSGRGALFAGRGQDQLAVAFVDTHGRSVGDLAGDDLVGQWILQIFLHRALERPRAIDRVVTHAAEPGPRRVGQLELDLAVLEQLAEPRELNIDDRAHVP